MIFFQKIRYAFLFCATLILFIFVYTNNTYSQQNGTNENSLDNLYSNVEQLQKDYYNDVQLKKERLFRNIFAIAFFITSILFIFVFITFRKKIKNLSKVVIHQQEQIINKKEELQKLSVILHNSENAISIATPNGEIEWINNAYSDFFGFSLPEIMKDKSRSSIFYTKEKEIKDLYASSILEKRPIVFQGSCSDKYGEIIRYKRHLIPIVDRNNEIQHFVAIDSNFQCTENVTELKK